MTGRKSTGEPLPVRPHAGTEFFAAAGSLTAWLHLLAFAFIVLAMSPLTRNLDNIKMALFLALGPLLPAAFAFERLRNRSVSPSPVLFLAWGGYATVAILSIVRSPYPWAGRMELFFLLSSFGFFLGGYVQSRSERSTVNCLKVVTGLLFALNLFGFFQFDLFGTGATGVSLLLELIGGDAGELSNPDSAFETLLYTFAVSAPGNLMSTILNRDFYAAFCLLFMAFPLSLGMVSPQKGWKATGFLTVALSLLSILLCQSKGEYLALLAGACLLAAFLALSGHRPSLRHGYWSAWVLGLVLLVTVILWTRSPQIGDQLKSLNHSFQSRLIIHRGAFNIFLSFPLLGAGPGSFKILFPHFRSPDYYEWGISNLTNFSHNFFLDVLSETGLFGFATILLLFGFIAANALRGLMRSSDPWITVPLAALLASWLAFLISNMTSVSARWPIGAVGHWTVIGVLAGLAQRALTSGKEAKKTEIRARRGMERDNPAAHRLRSFAFLILALMFVPLGFREAVTYWKSQRAFADGYLIAEQYRDYAIAAVYGGQGLEPDQERFLVDRLSEASTHLETATQIDPTLLTAYYHRGSTETLLAGLDPLKVGEHLAAALEDFEALRRLAPDYAELPYNLGVVHYELALLAEKGLELLPPENSPARIQLEKEFEEQQSLALTRFERMGELSNRPEVILNLGQSYLRAGHPDKALGVYRRGMELHPEDSRFPARLLQAAQISSNASAIARAQLALWRTNPLDLALVLGEDGALARLLEDESWEAIDAAIAEIEDRYPVDPRLYRFAALSAAKRNQDVRLKESIRKYQALGGNDPDVLTLKSF